MNRYQQRMATGLAVPTRLVEGAVSVGLAGLLMLAGTLSFPLPWTPVPFSMMPFALLVAGAMQRPAWSGLSVAIYLLAGGLGAPVFAEGNSGWRWFVGATAGYLFGFLLVAPMVSAYLARPRATSTQWLRIGLGLLGGSILAGLVTIAWFALRGIGFSDVGDIDGFGTGRSMLWVSVFLVASTAAIALLLRGRLTGRTAAALQLFIVMMAAVAVLHAIGVTVLWLMTPLSLLSAIVLGSIVFLPFDILKAALAVAATLPFVPTEESHA